MENKTKIEPKTARKIEIESSPMEESCKGGLKGYWNRRGYHRIDGGFNGRRRRRLGRAELGGESGGPRRRRFWRIKIVPRLRFFRKLSPLRLLSTIRDAYVRTMLRLASAPGFGYSSGGGARMTLAGFGDRPALKEYDEKVLVEIYKSILAHGPAIAASAADVGSVGFSAGGAARVALRQ